MNKTQKLVCICLLSGLSLLANSARAITISCGSSDDLKGVVEMSHNVFSQCEFVIWFSNSALLAHVASNIVNDCNNGFHFRRGVKALLEDNTFRNVNTV